MLESRKTAAEMRMGITCFLTDEIMKKGERPFGRSPQTVDKKGTFGFRKYPFTIISSFSSRQRSPFLSFHVASFFKFMDANKRVS